MSDQADLPRYTADQFTAGTLADCDVIMKGGVTSGVVYPYAVLEIATRHRLRSLGGTSAGAIAAAFAAAAEFARRGGDPAGFVRLQERCDALPDMLSGLFQPAPALASAVAAAREVAALRGGAGAVAAYAWRHAGLAALACGAAAGLAAWWLGGERATIVLAGLLALLVTAIAVLARHVLGRLVRPVEAAVRGAAGHGFGFCPGPTQPGATSPGLTDWLHASLQYIAFGDEAHPAPLTFGDLAGSARQVPIELRMVTTNLSMRRPHTLPELGFAAGFEPQRWQRYFPAAVMDHLSAVCAPWHHRAGALAFPQPQDLPVVVAARMSLSFPVLFTTVELHLLDRELPKVIHSLGGEAASRTVLTHFSDGGLSSNFPVHLFDAPLPSRPSYVFGLEELEWDPAQVTRRAALPLDARHGIGVRLKEIGDLATFLWQVLDSAKDWQDQLASQLPGQRERVARIYLDRDEGGLNLDMPPELSRQLMEYGAAGGDLFNAGFDMNEHRWRRLIMTYKLLSEYLDQLDRAWNGGSAQWFRAYRHQVKSYKGITKAQRTRMADNLDSLLAAWRARKPVDTRTGRFPKVRAALRIVPKF